MKYRPSRIAYFALPYALKPLRHFERSRLARVDPLARIEPPPIFIIGAPRTGSTILYQVLTNQFKVGYVSNLSALFFHSLWLGDRLHRLTFDGAPHDSFSSHYGRTRGLHSPNESGKFWYRWFPSERHFVTTTDVDPAGLGLLRRTIAAITEDSGEPFIFKNLNCGQRLQVLRHVVPEALFLVVARDPSETACSILRGRVERRGSADRWFSVMPGSVEQLSALPVTTQVVRQIHDLELQIEADLSLFPSEQSLWIRYEDFCTDPARMMERIASWVSGNGGVLALRSGARLPAVRQSTGAAVEPSDRAAIEAEVAKLDWGTVHSPDLKGARSSSMQDASLLSPTTRV